MNFKALCFRYITERIKTDPWLTLRKERRIIRKRPSLALGIKIMKLTTFFILVGCLQLAASGYSQTVSYSGKDVALPEVLKSIEKQSGYSFFYNSQDIMAAKAVTIQLKNVSLAAALEEIFKNQPLGYDIKGTTIFINQKQVKPQGPDPVGPVSEPPPIDVHGRIADSTGAPIAGASVQVKGNKSKGTSTDENGYFELKNVDENAVLVISGVNIESFEVRVNGRTELATLSAKIKSTTGKEVTIEANTGYQKVLPNEVTGSIVVITKKQLEQRVAPDLISKLEGIVPGLVFNKDALTGDNQLRIRGVSTIFGYTNPLVVVDNFPYPYEKLKEINPNDVESVTILKDASASSIWGAQAGNGVIVITTKRGRLNQPLKMELNASATITNKPDLFYIPYIKPSDYIDFETFLFKQGRYTQNLGDPNMPALSPVVEILNNRAKGLISPSDSVTQLNALRGYDWRNDQLKYLYRPSVDQQYSLSLSGGSNKISYYFSAGFDRTLSQLIGNDNNRITFRNRTTFNPISNLEIQTEINYLESTTHANGDANNNFYPYSRIIDENGKQLAFPRHRATWEDTISNHGFVDWHYYPLKERELSNDKNKGYTTRLSTCIRYKIIKGLNLEATYEYYHSINKSTEIYSENSFLMRESRNRFSILNSSGNVTGTNYPRGGQLNLASSEIVGYNGRFKIDFNRNWADHSIQALAGIDVREVKSEGNSSILYGYDENTGSFTAPDPITAYPTYPTGSSTTVDRNLGISDFETLNRYRSYFGNVSYSFKKRYSISGSGRLDQANIFGVNTNQKGTPLWSIGGKWDISKENFYKSKALPLLSFRLTYGYQGNFSPSAVAVVTLKYRNSPASYTGLPRAYISNFPNPELRWEKIGQLNLGLDFATMNNRVSGSIDYFRKNGKDLIGSSPIDPTTGIRQLIGNFSDMKSKGVDLKVTGRIIQTPSFNWSSTLIFNYAADRITRYEVPNSNVQYLNGYSSILPKVGYPVHGFFSYQWAGLDPATGGPRIVLADTVYMKYTSSVSSALKFEDLVYSGRYDPPYAGSWSNTVNWKNLSLSINITYKLGHYFRRKSINYSAFEYDWRSGHSDYYLRWQKPGDEKVTDVPSFIYPFPSYRDELYLNSTALVEKADHIRLQFINLNYQFANSFSKKLGFENLSVYFYANNIGIIWRANKHKIDPDYPYMSYPPARSYSFGIRAGF